MFEIEAVYEGGVFRPVGPVELPEHTRVRVAVPAPTRPAPSVRDILARRYASGDTDTAARHDEHQP
ncbi:MAG: antitoxin family protein [Gemmataceae bacterium]|nr:antitoxin family protein [Gemmataceae bacterium]